MCIRDRYCIDSTTPQLSTEGALVLTAVICSTVVFVCGAIFGMSCLYLVTRCKQSLPTTKNDQASGTHLPVPVYEDVQVSPQSPKQQHDKQTIELKENMAYGPIDMT